MISRRDLLARCSNGFGLLALSGLMGEASRATAAEQIVHRAKTLSRRRPAA